MPKLVSEELLEKHNASRAGKYIKIRFPYSPRDKNFLLTEKEFLILTEKGFDAVTEDEIFIFKERIEAENHAVFSYQMENAKGPRVTFEDPLTGYNRSVRGSNPGFEWVWTKAVYDTSGNPIGTGLKLQAIDEKERVEWGQYAAKMNFDIGYQVAKEDIKSGRI